jgi:HK97 family phage major capsid protein
MHPRIDLHDLNRIVRDGEIIGQMRSLLSEQGPQKRRVSTGSLADLVQAVAERDLTSGSAPAGGYLVGTKITPMQSLLARFDIPTQAGASVISNLAGPVVVPTITTHAGITWLASDGSSIGESDPTFGQGAMSPKFAAVKINVSRQLLLQSAVTSVVGVAVGESIGRGVTAAALAGTGASGQPIGLLNTPGAFSQSGTSLSAAGLRAMRKSVLMAGAREDRLTWIGAPDVQETLGSREFSAGSGRVLWADGKIEGRPAIATFLAPAGTLFLGDFSRMTIGIFDEAGASLETNPYENFMAGIASFRLILPIDFLFAPAAAFAVATGVN